MRDVEKNGTTKRGCLQTRSKRKAFFTAAKIDTMSVSKANVKPCSPKSAEEDNRAREMIVKLNRSAGNDVCADCGDNSREITFTSQTLDNYVYIYRSSVGISEFRSVHLHQMCWNPQELEWRLCLQGKIRTT